MFIDRLTFESKIIILLSMLLEYFQTKGDKLVLLHLFSVISQEPMTVFLLTWTYDANSVLSGRRQLVVAGGKESRLEDI